MTLLKNMINFCRMFQPIVTRKHRKFSCCHLDLKAWTGISSPSHRSIGQPTGFTHPFLMKEDEVTPCLTKQDYMERRNAVMSSVRAAKPKQLPGSIDSKAHVVILFGEPIRYMTEDIPYPFHQNTNFRYLTGFLEPESCLIMECLPDQTHYKTTLLVQERDPVKELWHGPRAGTDGALQHTGIDSTLAIEEFPNTLQKFLSTEYTIWYDFQKQTNLMLHMKYMRSFLAEAFDKKMNICTISDIIHQQRHVKSEREVFLMGQAAQISAEAFKRVMPISHPNMNESAIQAMLECECRLAGAQMLAYPPVVAGGSRANTLHYISNNQRINDGDLVLVDAGAEFHGYVADVTRTWPINGRFSPSQRILYDIVLRVQRACIGLCVPGTSLDEIFRAMALLLTQELAKNNILQDKVPDDELFALGRRFCPHHVGHWLGMDVHDTDGVPKSTKLQPGMVVTIEPGLYIREDDVTVHERFRGIGIRIEDDVLVTSSGSRELTDACPKDADEIEDIMSKR